MPLTPGGQATRWPRRAKIALFVVVIPSGLAVAAVLFDDRWPVLPPAVGNPEPLLAALAVAALVGRIRGGAVALATGMAGIAWRIVAAGMAADPRVWLAWTAALAAYSAVLWAFAPCSSQGQVLSERRQRLGMPRWRR